MSSGLLAVLGLVLACVRLSDARFLGGTLQLPSRDVKAQKPAAKSERGRSGAEHVRPAEAVDSLTWRFPEDPVEPAVPPPPLRFWPRARVDKERVAVRCGESRVQVEASQDLLGLGRLVNPEEVTLGGCPATDLDDLSHVLVFESELHGCGSTLVMTEKAFIYAFTLVYNPKVLSRGGITRSQAAVVGVECHYPR